MAKEKNLTAVTSVAAADFLRVVTSAGASVKATAANVAKYIVETYNGSTVAGSAQSVKAALDSLNSKFVSSDNATTLIEGVLGLSLGSPCVVHFSGSAGTTITGSTAQHVGVAIKADTNVVDMLCGAYASGKVYVCRVTKQSVGDYTVARKGVTLS